MAQGIGTLTVHPMCAKLTRDTDTFGKMDPYCIVTLGSNKQRTKVASSAGKFPNWSDRFTFRRNNEDQIRFEVWDRDTFSADDLVGECTINLHSVLRGGTNFDEWVELTYKHRRSGNLRVNISWTPENNSNSKGEQPKNYHPTYPPNYYQPGAHPPLPNYHDPNITYAAQQVYGQIPGYFYPPHPPQGYPHPYPPPPPHGYPPPPPHGYPPPPTHGYPPPPSQMYAPPPPQTYAPQTYAPPHSHPLPPQNYPPPPPPQNYPHTYAPQPSPPNGNPGYPPPPNYPHQPPYH